MGVQWTTPGLRVPLRARMLSQEALTGQGVEMSAVTVSGIWESLEHDDGNSGLGGRKEREGELEISCRGEGQPHSGLTENP